MSLRYIVHGPHITWTPTNLASRLEVSTKTWPRADNWGKFEYGQDFFMSYPDIKRVNTHTARKRGEYEQLNRFWRKPKINQREYLHRHNIPIPATFGINWNANLPSTPNRYICREAQHQRGEGYRITSDPSDIRMGEYMSRVFPKDSEWRILYVLGKPLFAIRKYLADDVQLNTWEPWTDSNRCYWMTVHQARNNRLLNTDVYDRLAALPIIKLSHIIGVDIMLAENTYVITEFNATPTLKVSNHLDMVAQYVRNNF